LVIWNEPETHGRVMSLSPPKRNMNQEFQSLGARQMRDISKFTKTDYDAACGFVFSQPFQAIMIGASMEARLTEGTRMGAVLAGIIRHVEKHPAWSDVSGYIERTFGLGGTDRNDPHAGAAEKFLDTLSARPTEYESLSRSLIAVTERVLADIGTPAPLHRFRAGVFDCSGLGDGHFWNADGDRVACSRQEAIRLAMADDLHFIEIDRTAGSLGHTANWRDFLVEREIGAEAGNETPAP
jgi:hypothetical protein